MPMKLRLVVKLAMVRPLHSARAREAQDALAEERAVCYVLLEI